MVLCLENVEFLLILIKSETFRLFTFYEYVNLHEFVCSFTYFTKSQVNLQRKDVILHFFHFPRKKI